MYQFSETFLFIYPSKDEVTCSISIRHDAIMSTDNARKKSKTYDPCTVFMLQTFVVYQGYFFIDDRSEKLLIMRLLFPGMGKKQIGLFGYQLIDWHFLDAKENVAAAHILHDFDACPQVFLV